VLLVANETAAVVVNKTKSMTASLNALFIMVS
jgi:hypothetical protein